MVVALDQPRVITGRGIDEPPDSPTPEMPLDRGSEYTNELLILVSAPLLSSLGKPVTALNIQREIDGIVDALNDVPEHFSLKVTVKIATIETLLKVFSDKNRPLIIHFIGHGMLLDASYALVLEDDTGMSRPFAREELGRLLKDMQQPPCQLAVLNACHSEGMATELLDAGVPHVIAINASDRVLDVASQTFSRLFYYSLWNEQPIQQAFERGRSSVEHSDELQQIYDPLTLQRVNRTEAPKFRLLPATLNHQSPLSIPSRTRGEVKGPQWEHTNLSAEDRTFVGRRREIHDLVKLLRKYPLVMIHGMGGMGKSTLAYGLGRWSHERQLWRDGVWKVELGQESSLSGALNRLQWSLLNLLGRIESLRLESLSQGLRNKHCLLILDDLDALRSQDPEGTKALLGCLNDCRRVTVLLTARRDLPSELLGSVFNYEIPGLRPEDSGTAFSLYAPPQEQWQLHDTAARDFSALLQFFDGYPLPIRLAATYMKAKRGVSFQQLCEVLDIDPLNTMRPVSEPERRENSLRASLDLSYGTLPPDGKDVFPHLALFPSGLSEQMAEYVWDGRVVEALSVLLQFSMAELSASQLGRRFRLPEPARYYAESKLEQDIASIAPLVLRYFHDYARTVHDLLVTDKRSLTAQRYLQEEQGNLQSFLNWGYTHILHLPISM